MHFCPNEWAVGNLKRRRGEKVNTLQNTLLDALALAQAEPDESPLVTRLKSMSYFLFVIHRQENLFDEVLARALVEKMVRQSEKNHCVFLLHHLTQEALQRMGLLAGLRELSTMTLVPRLPYIEFMQVLSGARYVVTDGGSNQEECYYLGKPCLILRKVTERTEGLGHNVVLSGLDMNVIDEFFENPARYNKPPIHTEESPSKMIAQLLEEKTRPA